MSCLNCGPGGLLNYLKIKRVVANSQVKPGDTYHIYVDVANKNPLFISKYGRTCLYEGESVLAQSKSFKLQAGEYYYHEFTGIMPDHDLYLNISLVEEYLGFGEECEDGHQIVIQKSSTTIPVDPEPPLEPSEDQDIGLWIMDNIVLILILLLVIILVLKFG